MTLSCGVNASNFWRLSLAIAPKKCGSPRSTVANAQARLESPWGWIEPIFDIAVRWMASNASPERRSTFANDQAIWLHSMGPSSEALATTACSRPSQKSPLLAWPTVPNARASIAKPWDVNASNEPRDAASLAMRSNTSSPADAGNLDSAHATLASCRASNSRNRGTATFAMIPTSSGLSCSTFAYAHSTFATFCGSNCRARDAAAAARASKNAVPSSRRGGLPRAAERVGEVGAVPGVKVQEKRHGRRGEAPKQVGGRVSCLGVGVGPLAEGWWGPWCPLRRLWRHLHSSRGPLPVSGAGTNSAAKSSSSSGASSRHVMQAHARLPKCLELNSPGRLANVSCND